MSDTDTHRDKQARRHAGTQAHRDLSPPQGTPGIAPRPTAPTPPGGGGGDGDGGGDDGDGG